MKISIYETKQPWKDKEHYIGVAFHNEHGPFESNIISKQDEDFFKTFPRIGLFFILFNFYE